ncbi:actin family [Tribonema minus]|uniref:Actin family n=1 Tax=Tribonema minus TaxID=303371 RepID=A0A835YRK8_9STRA|nr:actin family [Tribonema minus]
MYCGDEIAGVVGDVGTCHCKFGYAGEDVPKHMFRSAAGYLPCSEGGVARETTRKKRKKPGTEPAAAHDGQWFIGDQSLSKPRAHMEVRGPLTDGLVTDWDLLERLWEHAYALMRAQPADRPALCVEASWGTRKQRAAHMELMLEGFNCPALYIAKAGALAAFGAGRATALVCELGHVGAAATPVVEGHVLNRAVRRSDRALHWLAEETLRLLAAREHADVAPRYAARGAAAAAAPLPSPIHPSYVRYWREDVALDFVAACMRVPSARGWPPGDGSGGDASSASEMAVSASEESGSGGEDGDAPASSYELPDGTIVHVDAELRGLPGALYLPPPGATAAAAAAAAAAAPHTAPQLCAAALGASDGDARKELVNNLVVTGGGALLRGTAERLTHDVARLLPGAFRVRVLAPPPLERRFGAWIGGSILCCLGTFQQLWLSRAEYAELGPDRADDRFGG